MLADPIKLSWILTLGEVLETKPLPLDSSGEDWIQCMLVSDTLIFGDTGDENTRHNLWICTSSFEEMFNLVVSCIAEFRENWKSFLNEDEIRIEFFDSIGRILDRNGYIPLIVVVTMLRVK